MATTEAKSLEVTYKTQLGKTVTLSISDPKDDLTKAVAQPIMQQVIDKKIIVSDSGELVSLDKMQIRATTITDLA